MGHRFSHFYAEPSRGGFPPIVLSNLRGTYTFSTKVLPFDEKVDQYVRGWTQNVWGSGKHVCREPLTNPYPFV